MIMCVFCSFFKVQLHTYWQSKGDTPHIITINVYVKILQFIVQFPKRVILSSIQLYTLYSTDSSYSPSLISILESQDGFHFQEYETFTINKIDNWFVVVFKRNNKVQLNTIKNNRPLSTFSLQIIIHEMHDSGRNTRIRQVRLIFKIMIQIQLLSPKEQVQSMNQISISKDPFFYTSSSLRYNSFLKQTNSIIYQTLLFVV